VALTLADLDEAVANLERPGTNPGQSKYTHGSAGKMALGQDDGYKEKVQKTSARTKAVARNTRVIRQAHLMEALSFRAMSWIQHTN